MTPALRLTLLGGAHVARSDPSSEGERPVAGFISRKAPALLCYLAVTGRPHSREALATLLWGDISDAAARASLRQVLANLHKLVGDHLSIGRDTVAFDRAAPYWLDVEAFQAHVAAAARRHHPAPPQSPQDQEHRMAQLRAAVDLYRGDFLDGFSVRDAPLFDEWVVVQRERLRHVALQALHELAAGHTAQGEYLAGVEVLTQLLALDPWREEAHRQLMALLAQSGQRDAALARYEACRRVLAQELGAEPAPETVALADQIRTGTFTGAGGPGTPPGAAAAPWAAAPEVATGGRAGHEAAAQRDAVPHSLPAQLTSFIGRERELEETRRLLATTRLLTLTGPGGSGKTRLALALAGGLVADDRTYPDGVWLVELAALSDPELVPQAVASVLGAREVPGRTLLDVLGAMLRSRRLLLVLDNCEHLLLGCARLAETLLRACPDLRILATGREALGIAGETAWRVPSLSFPDPQRPPPVEALAQYEAVRLFVERAQAVQPHFALTGQNAPAAAQICQQLDGIPLAIELAAARVRVLPVEQLLARLEDRFRLLTGGSRTALARHQTLQAAVDWSYHLLAEQEKTLFARLAVFAGGFTLEAAEAVCGDGGVEEASVGAPAAPPGPQSSIAQPLATMEVLDLLTRLVDKSLVAVDEQPDCTARYRLLETLRAYARERLEASGEAEALGRRHAAYYLALAERDAPAQPVLAGVAWLARLRPETDNLRAALQWALERGHADWGLRLTGALGGFWLIQGYWSEGRAWCARALALPGAQAWTARRAQALTAAAAPAMVQFDFAAARPLCEEVLAICRRLGDERGVTNALVRLSLLAAFQGDWAAARALFDECAPRVAAARAAGDRRWRALMQGALGHVAYALGETPAALALLAEAEPVQREVGDWYGLQWALRTLGCIAQDAGDHAAARARFGESRDLNRAAGDANGLSLALFHLGDVAADRGDAAEARACFAEGLTLQAAQRDRRRIATLLEAFAGLAAAQGRAGRALRLAGAAAAALAGAAAGALQGAAGVHQPRWQAKLARRLAPARQALGEAGAAAAWAAGQAMTAEQALAYALEAPAAGPETPDHAPGPETPDHAPAPA